MLMCTLFDLTLQSDALDIVLKEKAKKIVWTWAGGRALFVIKILVKSQLSVTRVWSGSTMRVLVS